MNAWYGVDMSKLSLRECWRLGRPHGRVLATFRLRFRGRHVNPFIAIRRKEALATCTPADLPQVARESIEAAADRLEQVRPGFRRSIWWRSDSMSTLEAGGHALVSHDGLTLAILLAIARPAPRPMISVTKLTSRRRDGIILSTIDSRARLNARPGTQRVHRPGSTAAELVALHERRIAGLALVPFGDDADVERFHLQATQESFDHGVRRGRYVPLTDAELARIRKRVAATGRPMPDADGT